MSLFGSMNTAISGLTAQSAAFSNISDNVANSQSAGYKGVDTNFEDFITTSTATQNDSGAVVALPSYTNNVQGTIATSSDPLAMAITGQGFFAVSEAIATSVATGQPTFSAQQYYTRAGDFSLDKNGYLVNSAGQYLNGWPVDASTGQVNQNQLAPIQVTQSSYSPVATSEVTLSANLPATPAANAPVSSQVTVYDSLGTQHTITLNWTQNAQGDWTVGVQSPDDVASANRGTAEVKFGTQSANPVPDGTVGSIGNASGSVTTSGFAANGPATLSFTTNFGNGPQPITLNLGSYGGSSGLTQFAGTTYSLQGLTQNGVPPGSYSGVTTTSAGDIVVNYNNGQSRTIAQVPVVTFNSPDSLQRQNGQAFTATLNSGNPIAQNAGSNGAGGLVTGSVEGSNVDIATQFSKLIVAQQAYSANTKVVTTANDLLQQTINMKQ
ncbi:MAG: flagellar hook protein FlgE [Acidisphaera sp.]|nr:flagellar hook protein FlgE [Acidisphaera sp.]